MCSVQDACACAGCMCRVQGWLDYHSRWLDAALTAAQVEGAMPISQPDVASAAWQFQWKRAELRVGAGVSSVPGAWLMQSSEFAWRFGGETKRGERKLRQAWRSDKRMASRAERRNAAAPEALDRG